MKQREFNSDDADLDIYCQGHDPECPSKNFGNRSLIIEKLLKLKWAIHFR